MKRFLAILGVIFLVSILYVELTSLTNAEYWASRHETKNLSYFLRKSASSNAKVIEPYNAFISFIPNILHTIKGIELNYKRNIAELKYGFEQEKWAIYRESLSPEYDIAMKEAEEHISSLSKRISLLDLTEDDFSASLIILTEKAEEILLKFYKVLQAKQQWYQIVMKSGIYAQERSTLWDSLKINPEYDDSDLLFTRASKYFSQLFVYTVVLLIVIILCPIAFGSGKKPLLVHVKSFPVYQLLRGCIQWSAWRFFVSILVTIATGLFIWMALFGHNPEPHIRRILPFVGLFWGGTIGILTYCILLIFSNRTYQSLKLFFQWKYWILFGSIFLAVLSSVLTNLILLPELESHPEDRVMISVAVLCIGIIVGLLSYLIIWISSLLFKIFLSRKKDSKQIEISKNDKTDSLKQEKEELEKRILSLEVAELKKKLAELEGKQEN